MGCRMKTTVELPDALLIAAKKRAAEDRTTLRAILERGLRRELKERRRPAAGAAGRRIRWVTVEGGLPEGLDISDRVRMHDWLRGRS
jgi:hypothetical protein